VKFHLLIHTGLQPGDRGPLQIKEPFQRFSSLGREEDETVKTVARNFFQAPITGLKPDVNDTLNCQTFEAKPIQPN